MEQITTTVQEYLEELGDDKLSLSEFDKIEDGVIIYMTRKVDELYQKTVEFCPDKVNLKGILINNVTTELLIVEPIA